MKIAIILGRGIEGCGVTRACINLHNFFVKNGIEVKSYASKDRKWPRSKSQQHNIIEFSNNEIENLSKELNTFDYIYYASLPSKSHKLEYCQLFEKFLVDGITGPKKIMIQHDHNIMSLNRNYNMWEITKKMDLAFNFAQDSAFSINARSLGVKVLEMLNGFEFEKYEKYIKPIENLQKRVTYFGRFATFKDPIRLIYMHKYLKDAGFITEMRGIERSLGALPIFYEDIKAKKYRENIDLSKDSVQTPEKVHIYGPYIYEEGLEQLSNSAFGTNFYNLKKGYGGHIEFATLEIIACGLIPIVDEGRAKNTKYKEGMTYYDIKDAFIFCNKQDLESCVQLIEKVYNDKNELLLRRDNCLRIAKEIFNIDKAYGKLYKDTLDYFNYINNIANDELNVQENT